MVRLAHEDNARRQWHIAGNERRRCFSAPRTHFARNFHFRACRGNRPTRGNEIRISTLQRWCLRDPEKSSRHIVAIKSLARIPRDAGRHAVRCARTTGSHESHALWIPQFLIIINVIYFIARCISFQTRHFTVTSRDVRRRSITISIDPGERLLILKVISCIIYEESPRPRISPTSVRGILPATPLIPRYYVQHVLENDKWGDVGAVSCVSISPPRVVGVRLSWPRKPGQVSTDNYRYKCATGWLKRARRIMRILPVFRYVLSRKRKRLHSTLQEVHSKTVSCRMAKASGIKALVW